MRIDSLRPVAVASSIVVCALLTVVMFHLCGPIGIVLMAPVWGGLLALPLLDGFAAAIRLMRWLSWIDVEGHYYEHRARWVDVVEDAGGQRFIRVDHLRQFLPDLPADATFVLLYAGRTLAHGRPALAYLRDDALLEYLAKASSDDAIKLHQWVDRHVLRPGKKRREHEGR